MRKKISLLLKRLSALFLFTALAMCLNTPAAVALTFNDGMVHTIDGLTDVSFSVYNNVNPPYDPTTVVYTGEGNITVDLHDSSIFIDKGITGGGQERSHISI